MQCQKPCSICRISPEVKLIYNGVTMPLTAIADFAEKGKTDPLFKELARLVEETHGIWNEQAEKYLLAQFGVDIGEAAQ